MARRPAIPAATKLSLFAAAAGYCQNPHCLRRLFPERYAGRFHIAEMAHVLPWSSQGPREEAQTDNIDRHSFDNLILLCPTCHTEIDKAPDSFPRELLLEWKRGHLAALNRSNGIKRLDSRDAVAEAIAAKLAENFGIWDRYAPGGDGKDHTYDHNADVHDQWSSLVKSRIIPNHHHVLAIIETNLHLATPSDVRTLGQYKEHVRGFTARHILDDFSPVVRYPKDMEKLFR